MSTNFWELLQQHQGDLTKSGRTVAEYLVQHAAEAQYLSISSLARECQVAEATVFRFCRALGFEGYHEMRIALAQANATGVLVNQQEPAPDADTATLCEHASALFMTAINGTQNALSPQAVDQAVALLHSAGRCSAWDRAAAWPPPKRSAPGSPASPTSSVPLPTATCRSWLPA